MRHHRLLWPLVAGVIALGAIIWWLSGSDGTFFGGKAGFASVSGSWRFDEDGFRADLAAREEAFAERPVEAANAVAMRKQLERIAAPYLATTFTFLATSYTARQEGVEHETSCSYVGASPLLLHVVGAADGEADDLTIILDPASRRIHLRTIEAAFPFIRE